MKWFRLYSAVLHDPKVQRLSPALFKHWINLLCLASESDPRGLLPCVDDIAFALRIKPSDAHAVMAQLTRAGVVDETQEGRAFPHNWTQRQHDSDDVAARVARHRRSKSGNQAVSLDGQGEDVTLHETLPVTATKRPVDPETERDTDPENALRHFVATAAVPATADPLAAAPSPSSPLRGPHSATASAENPGPALADADHPVDTETAKPASLPKPKPFYADDSVPMQLARSLGAGIHSHKPDAKLPRGVEAWQAWAREMDLALRVDHRPREKIEAVIAYAMHSSFWRGVIFSARKLREKFDVLDSQRLEDANGTRKQAVGQAGNGRSSYRGSGNGGYTGQRLPTQDEYRAYAKRVAERQRYQPIPDFPDDGADDDGADDGNEQPEGAGDGGGNEGAGERDSERHGSEGLRAAAS